MGLFVIDPGFWTTVQDRGRRGYREFGVPAGGSFDQASAGLANALVANPPDAAVLELTLRGGVYEAKSKLGVAIAGAPIEATLISPGRGSKRLHGPSSLTLRPGDRLVLGQITQGARAYLAVRHGIQTQVHFGSRSSEEPLNKGNLLPVLEGEGAVRTRWLSSEWNRANAEPFRIMTGPDWSSVADRKVLLEGAFRVDSRGNRVGLRLEGPRVEVASPEDRLSAPVAPGAIQAVGGQLIVLGVAGGTMGGYPHIGHLISADLDRLGQLVPGDLIRFQEISLAEARAIDRAQRTASRLSRLSIASLAGDLL